MTDLCQSCRSAFRLDGWVMCRKCLTAVWTDRMKRMKREKPPRHASAAPRPKVVGDEQYGLWSKCVREMEDRQCPT